jgi:hypothetical protein
MCRRHTSGFARGASRRGFVRTGAPPGGALPSLATVTMFMFDCQTRRRIVDRRHLACRDLHRDCCHTRHVKRQAGAGSTRALGDVDWAVLPRENPDWSTRSSTKLRPSLLPPLHLKSRPVSRGRISSIMCRLLTVAWGIATILISFVCSQALVKMPLLNSKPGSPRAESLRRGT